MPRPPPAATCGISWRPLISAGGQSPTSKKVTSQPQAASWPTLPWRSAARLSMTRRSAWPWTTMTRSVGSGALIAGPGSILEQGSHLHISHSLRTVGEKRTSVQEYSLLSSDDPLHLAEKLQAALKTEQPVFTQWSAGWLRHSHTTPTVVTAYVEKFPDESVIEEKLLARREAATGRSEE